MTTFERITYRRPGGERRSVILQDPAEIGPAQARLIFGLEVDKQGEPAEPPKAFLREHGAETGDRRHLIERDLVVKRERLEVGLFYAELVAVGTAKIGVKP